jgi:hypothetical protein
LAPRLFLAGIVDLRIRRTTTGIPGEPEAFMNPNEQDDGPIGGLLCVLLALVLMLII